MQHFNIKTILCTLFLLVFCHNLLAQNPYQQKVNNFNCTFSADVSTWFSQNVDAKVSKPQLVLLQFEKILQTSDKQLLANSGIEILEYIGDKSYSAFISSKSQISIFKNIIGITSFLPEFKINPIILEHAKSKKKVNVLVSFHKGITLEKILEHNALNMATLLPGNWQKRGLYSVELPSSKLQSYASFYGVKYISVVSENVPLDLDSKGSEGGSILNMPSGLGGKGLRGKGVMVGIGDNASGIYHIDQSDRTINYNNGNKSNHGVFVHSIVGGEGIMDLAGQGLAPDGTCISLFFDAVILLKQEMFQGFNMTITNNSYAAVVNNCSYAGTYDNISQNLDSFAFETKEQLDIFAVGNDGRLACGAYPAGYYNVCGGFQTAKNIISVGATSRDLVLGAGSSRGPLKDGRLKPEITAAGIDIMGAINDNAYQINRGTSFAAPQVTGMLALLSERYKQLNFGANPKGDLLKALVVNGASDLGRPGPDFLFGFGFLNGVRSLDMIENNRYSRGTMNSGGATQSFNISVPSNTAQLKVMLYYHDPMASASATKQLVNDLDLTVTEPGGTIIHRPLVLDSSPTGVANNATEAVDRLNNIEQVTINNPPSGSYTVSVADFLIPSGPQEYVVVYDFVPNEVKLMFPIANAAVAANADMYIYWEAPFDALSTTKIEFSSNNGSTWTTIAASIPANQRFFQWPVPNINSNECKVRITKGTMTDVSGNFVVNAKPVITVSSVQCPGSFAISWPSIPTVDKYYLLLKKGAHFQKVDSVNAGVLNYTFKGLNPNLDYYVSVLPSISGKDGFRSNAAVRKPNSGTCAGFSDGDLSLEAILSPSNGRRSTSLELKKKSPIILKIRNQDNDPVSNYNVSYKVNSSPWKTISGFSIPANTTANPIVDSFDFSDTIAYQITLAVKNMDKIDPVNSNDTLVIFFKHFPNNLITLTAPIKDGFEMLADMTILKDTIGLDKVGYWDYSNSNNDTGRLRSRIPGSKLVKSSRSISLDVNVNNKRSVNYFTGTFNLSNYDTSIDEVRFDFDYEMRGMPTLRDSNKVWVRGSDLQAWIPAFNYSNVLDTSKLHNSGTLSLRDLFRKNNQNFSTSVQIRFGQFDSTLIVDDNYGGGVTIDNFNLYKVLKDVQLTKVEAPFYSDCNLNSTPISLRVKNGTITTAKSIQIAYSIDGLPYVIENIPDSLIGGDSLLYTFTKGVSVLGKGKHFLNAWIHMAGDDFLKNDTINNFVFYNAIEINQFPYLQNFESNDGDWYVNGRNPSWSHGVPAGLKINTAASGQKVWKTNLNGNHNSNELSYLVSPCINTINLSKPMMSFSQAFDLERCVDVCDRVYVEYSWDNEQTWSLLGDYGKGTNWYNNDVYNVWNGEQTRWKVSSFELPRAAQLKLRFVMASDFGTNLDGFALDDIHIFDLKEPIFEFSNVVNTTTGSLALTGSAFEKYTQNGSVYLAINPLGQNLGALNAKSFQHKSIIDTVLRQYVFPRSFLVQKNSTTLPIRLRLYITDQEVNQVFNDTTCKSCSRPVDIYRTGITHFVDSNNKFEDSNLANNYPKGNKFYVFNNIVWVPYDKGYYSEFETNRFGEFWLNGGGILGSLPANTQYVHLQGKRLNDQQAELSWVSPIDSQIQSYKILRSMDSISFVEVKDMPSVQKVNLPYVQLDNPNPQQDQKVYYQLLCTAKNLKTFFSNVVSIQWTKGDMLLGVYPIPSLDGNLKLKWTSAIGNIAHYSLFDMTGKLILKNEIKSTSWLNDTELPLGFLAKGMYFLKIEIGSNKYQEKVIFK
jgi:hypothetical protein